VDMLLVTDVLLVHHVSLHPLLIVLPPQDVIESLLKVPAISVQVLARVISEQQQLSLMRLRRGVALEPIRIPALLLAHLAVPPQLLQTLGLHLV